MLLALPFLLSGLLLGAQNNRAKTDDLGRIVLNSYVPTGTGIPSSPQRMLKSKLDQAATRSGMGGSTVNPRFVLAANVNVISKDLTSSAPPMTALSLEVMIFVGDAKEGTKFSSTSFEVKGVGTNESKAYTAAIKQIKPTHAALQRCIMEGKAKIIEYYNSNCDFILKDAEALVAQKKYEKAILKLTSVPEVCKECYDKCLSAIEPMYQQSIDRTCDMALSDARNAWSSAQDVDAANKAAKHLSKIDPKAACYEDAKALSAEIAARVKELDQRDWDFAMKEYDAEMDTQKAALEASKAIAVAYANNPPAEEEKDDEADMDKVEDWW